MEEKKRVSPFVKILIGAAAVFLLSLLLSDIKSDQNYWIDKNGKDSGIYLEADQPLYVSKGNLQNVGNHAVIVGTPVKEDAEIDKSLVYAVSNLRTDQNFILLSEEALPDGQLEIDGLIVGYLQVPDSVSGTVTRYLPILRVTSHAPNGDSRLELAAPVLRMAEPGRSVSESGITLTLNRIEYRGKLARIACSLTNESESAVLLDSFEILSGGSLISGTLVVTTYSPPAAIRKYLSGQAEVLPSPFLDPGEQEDPILGTLPIEPGDPVEIIFRYVPVDSDAAILNPDQPLDTIELRLVYTPDTAESGSSGPEQPYGP